MHIAVHVIPHVTITLTPTSLINLQPAVKKFGFSILLPSFSTPHSFTQSMTLDAFANSRLLSEHPAPQNTRVEALRRLINRKHGLHLSGYPSSDYAHMPFAR